MTCCRQRRGFLIPVFPTALKKPAVTQKRHEAQEMVMGAVAGAGAVNGLGAQSLSLDLPRLQQDIAEGRAMAAAPPGVRQAEKAVVFEENNKAGIKADELGEQQRQIRGKDASECITLRLSDSQNDKNIYTLLNVFFLCFLQLLKPRIMGIT